MTRSIPTTGSARPAPAHREQGGLLAAARAPQGVNGGGPGRSGKNVPRETSAPVLTETEVHLQVADYMRKVGLGGCAIAFHIRNERPGPWQKIQAHRMGVLPGICDWCIIDGGRVGFIELKPAGFKDKKRRSNKYSTHEMRQGEAQALLRRAGCWVEICESLDEVLATLRYHGVPLRDDVKEQPLITALRQSMTAAELEADAIGSHDAAMQEISRRVQTGEALPALHAHLFSPRRRRSP
jgi:hypothetical protein